MLVHVKSSGLLSNGKFSPRGGLAALLEVADEAHHRPKEGEIDERGADQRRGVGVERLRVVGFLEKLGKATVEASDVSLNIDTQLLVVGRG